MGRTVTLGSRSFELVAPSDTAAVVDCIDLLRRNPTRACYMALALCWPNEVPGRPGGSYSAAGYDSGKFSGQVLKDLLGKGASVVQVAVAGGAALNLVAIAFPTKPEVVAAEGFSEPPVES